MSGEKKKKTPKHFLKIHQTH